MNFTDESISHLPFWIDKSKTHRYYLSIILNLTKVWISVNELLLQKLTKKKENVNLFQKNTRNYCISKLRSETINYVSVFTLTKWLTANIQVHRVDPTPRPKKNGDRGEFTQVPPVGNRSNFPHLSRKNPGFQFFARGEWMITPAQLLRVARWWLRWGLAVFDRWSLKPFDFFDRFFN